MTESAIHGESGCALDSGHFVDWLAMLGALDSELFDTFGVKNHCGAGELLAYVFISDLVRSV